MSVNLRRLCVALGTAAAMGASAVVGLVAAPAHAAPAGAGDTAGSFLPFPIRPNQHFTGLVNGRSSESRIAVNCDGPTRDGVRTGHPLPGQTVMAVPTDEPGPADGYTGTSASAITVNIDAGATTTLPLVLRSYRAPVSIPTDILLPCEGGRVISFTPNPADPTMHRAIVKVLFVSIG